MPFRKGTVVTFPGLLIRYRQLIPSDIDVVTTESFFAILLNMTGLAKSASKRSSSAKPRATDNKCLKQKANTADTTGL